MRSFLTKAARIWWNPLGSLRPQAGRGPALDAGRGESSVSGDQGRNSPMLSRQAFPQAHDAAFDFTSAMWMLCDDITTRLDELLHVDM
jgi:hypothetical protein